jgi:hypothetical protein
MQRALQNPFVHAEMFQKNVYSDEHFDRCFSFCRNGGQITKPKKRKEKP